MHAAAAPDLITFTCSSCNANLQVSSELAGQTGPCPICGETISAPIPAPPVRTYEQPAPPRSAPMGVMPPVTPPDQGLPSSSVPEPAYHAPPKSIPPVQPQSYSNRGVPAEGVELDAYSLDESGSYLGSGAIPRDQAGGPGLGMAMGMNQGGQQAYSQAPPMGGTLAGYGPAPSLEYSRAKRQFPWVLTILVTVLLSATGYLLWKMDILAIPGTDPASQRLTQPMTPPPIPRQPAMNAEQPAPADSADPAPAPAPAPPTSGGSNSAPSTPIGATELVNPTSPDAPLQPVSGNEPPPAISDPTPVIDASAPITPAPTAQSGLLGPPREAVQNFLQAKSWRERLPFIYNGTALESRISAYYTDNPQKDVGIRDYRLDFFHNENHESGANIYVFFLTLEEQEGFPVLVLEHDGGHLIDWELFVEFQDRRFKQFIDSGSKDPKSFRVVIQRVTYWEPDRDQIPNVDSLICYKIDPPYPGSTQYAFVPTETGAGKKMMESLSWETEPLAAEVKLHWEKFADGRPYLTVDELVSRSWVRP